MLKNRLKEIRMKEYMMSQTEFAEMLDIAQAQYNRYEKCSAAPSLEVALQISEKLNRDIKQIFFKAE